MYTQFRPEKKYILYLLYAYAFLVTLEHILFVLYDITTIFKPYRVLGLIIIVIVFFNTGTFILSPKERHDRYLIWFVLFWGLLTFLYILFGLNINIDGFLNLFIQISLNLAIFLALKQIRLSHYDLMTVLKFYTWGILVNAIVMITEYYFVSNEERVSGFMDNPNSGSTAISVSILFIILLLRKNNFSPFRLSSWFYVTLILILTLAVFAAGSRTGIVLLIVGSILYMGFMVTVKSFTRLTILVILGYASFTVYSNWNKKLVESVTRKLGTNRFFIKIAENEEDIRVFLWKGGVDAFVDSNFMGIGLAQFSSNMDNFKKYMSPYLPQYVRKREIQHEGGLGLHNMYMDILVEGGVISLALLLIYFYRIIVLRVKSLRQANYKDVDSLLLSIVIILLLTSFTGDGLLSGAFWFSIFITSKTYPFLMESKNNRILEKFK